MALHALRVRGRVVGVRRWDSLNERQVELLQRIVAGDDLSGADGVPYRQSARALQGRGLVQVTRKGGGWQAYPTDAGRFYLEHGHHPDHPGYRGSSDVTREQTAGRMGPGRQATGRPISSKARSGEAEASAGSASVPEEAAPHGEVLREGAGAVVGDVAEGDALPAARRKRRSAVAPFAATTVVDASEITAELLLSRLRAAGGRLVIADVSVEEFAAWRHAAKVAQLRLFRAGRERLGRSTDGQKLALGLVRATQDDDDELTDKEYEALIQSMTPQPILPRTEEFLGRSVPVPASKVTKPHPVVEELTAAAELFDRRWKNEYGPYTSLAAVRRPIVRMRRIWQALVTEALFRGYDVHVEQDRRDYYDHGRLVLEIGPDAYSIDLHGDSTTPLRLAVPDNTQRRRRSDVWADADGEPIEQRLGGVFTAIERRAERAVEQRAAQKRRDDERRRQWKASMAEAHKLYEEDQREQLIARRVADAEYADDIRAYAQVLLVRAAQLGQPRGDSVQAWAQWALDHADDIDPRRLLAGMPAIPEPKPEQLKPFLRGFSSPYGP